MLKFYVQGTYLNDTVKYVSSNAVGSEVELVKYRDGSCEVVVEHFGDNPQQVGGTNTFERKVFDNFKSATQWAESVTQHQTFKGD